MEKRFETFIKQVEKYVEDKFVPGAVVAIGRGDEIFDLKAYGNAIITPVVEPMTEDTLFDIASLSKLTGVWAPMVLLLQEGKVSLDTPLPVAIGKKVHPELEKVTVSNLLTHTAGLVPFMDTDQFGPTREERINGLLNTPPVKPLNTEVVYSDLSFIFLGEIIAFQSEKKVRCEPFQVWTLTLLKDGGAVLVGDDGNGNEIAKKELEYTDFPLPEGIRVYLDGNVLLLPSEY